ncbi:putative basal body component [Leishmania major strain Friedlin]|uniref:Putative basal body component n=1 Tax=Leishmania major TaxID=5664 RepID=Q4QAB2_LEIMA|nr:putative basal body component [Leishmania major strain Friedlin]CAG9574723.1 Trypanosome_basal_body_component_protein [Leishmania major strain Friedlin]CAJ05382.1 putative basal body component [Leishmania major strain Friedlin]|eukprot:XP_001683736.1 putative basal body component [Leishmania major strain Friedlin]
MVSDGAPKSGPVPSDHVDQLLEEYLRVINDKDDQLHRLLRQLQDQEAAAGKREEDHTTKQRQLSEQLQSKSRKLKEMQAQSARDEEAVRKLVLNSEALKKQLQESEEHATGHAVAAAEAAAKLCRLECDLSNAQATLAAVQAQKTKCDEGWAATQLQLEAQTAAVANLKSELEVAMWTLGETRSHAQQLEARIQEMMPIHEHTSALAALEAKSASERVKTNQDIEKLQDALSSGEIDHRTTKQALRKAQQDVEELTALLQTTTKALDTTKHQLTTADLTKQQTERELREEAARCRRAQMESAERVGELERSLVRSQEALQRTTAELQAACAQHERYKAVSEKAHEGVQAQNRTLQEQLRQSQDEADRVRRLLETRERMISDSADALARAREEATRTQAELRERLATVTAAAASRAEERDRLQHQLSRAQSELADAQRRTAADEHSLAQKLEELQSGVQRLHLQLRDKEEETRRAELVHGKELQKLQHDHAFAVEDMRRRHESEVQDLHARLELARAELSERAGGSKGLEKELHHVAEVRQSMRSEMSRLQNAIEAKETVIQGLQREADKQQAEVAQLTQRLAAHERSEGVLRQRIEEAERAQLDSKAARERAEESVVAIRKTAEARAATLAAVEAQLSEKDGAIAALRLEVRECVEAKQVAFKEVMQEKANCDKLTLSWKATEERADKAEMELRVALQEQQRLQRCVDERSKEVRLLKEEGEQRDAECARLARHAEDVESLAKRTAEELRQTIHERDDTIQRLRSEQATVLPHLNEEKGKSLVLLEKLQHQQELSRMHMDNAQQRIRSLEEAVSAREAEVAALQCDKARAEQQLLEVQAQVTTLTGTLDSREHKYQQRKEEVQKALQQLEEVKASTVASLERAEGQTAAANAIRERYKTEKAKMEALLQRMEERVRASAKREKEDCQREADLMKKLTETEEALRRAQDIADTRVSEVKSRYEAMCRQQEESFRDATNGAMAAEKLATSLQMQLHEAQRRALSVEGSYRELQRHVAASRALALEEYAEEATEMKRACMDLVLRAHSGTVSRAASVAKDSWSVAQKIAAELCEGARDTERHLVRLQLKHKAELQAVEEAHQRRMEAAAAEHHEEVARVQRELAEAERCVLALKEAAQRSDSDREHRTHALKDSLERVTALLEIEKRQTASLQERVAADDAKRSSDARAAEEERRSLQHHYDKLKRQLDDRAVEQKHNEDELRELRAEVAALQRVLGEKRREAKQEADRATKEQERLVAAVEAREVAEQRCGELQKQINFMRGQLETARLSHERVVTEHQATQRTRDMRLEGAQAELATAVAERRRYQREVESLEQRVKELTKEVQMLRQHEADILGQLQSYKAETSALRERCANVESLKNISEASLAETQARERDLMEKIEELRNAQQLMQLCFDKQQEQLEVGRRLRQQDALQGSRFSS